MLSVFSDVFTRVLYWRKERNRRGKERNRRGKNIYGKKEIWSFILNEERQEQKDFLTSWWRYHKISEKTVMVRIEQPRRTSTHHPSTESFWRNPGELWKSGFNPAAHRDYSGRGQSAPKTGKKQYSAMQMYYATKFNSAHWISKTFTSSHRTRYWSSPISSNPGDPGNKQWEISWSSVLVPCCILKLNFYVKICCRALKAKLSTERFDVFQSYEKRY